MLSRTAVRALCLAPAVVLVVGACSVSLRPGGGTSSGPAATAGLPRVSQPGAYRAQPAPRQGGTITIGTWQFPRSLSPYFNSEAAAIPIDQAIFDGLLTTGPDLASYGDLAASVPTLENGGVRRAGEGMDVTYQLRPGLTWSDGQPLTADDVVFTYRLIAGAGAVAGLSQEGYNHISSVERTDDHSVVVHFSSLYPAYGTLFSAIVPRHRLETVPADRLPTDAYWTQPDVVSGPFTVEKFTRDRVALRRNPHYGDGRTGMPFLGHLAYAEQVVFRALPSRQAVLAALKAGDVQAGFDLTERELATVARLAGERVVLTPSLAYEQVSLNQADPNPATGAAPPWVGDPVVSQALDLALDRPALERRVGERSPLIATPVSSLLAWAFDAGTPAPTYDLGRARALLDQDGWAVGSDGVRVKNGRRLTFVLSTAADQQLRATERDVIVAGWRRLGIDVQVQDFPVAQLFGPLAAGGVLARGLYEAALWSWITPPDPDSEFSILHSSSTPAAGRSNAENYSRCHDPAVDRALAAGRATLDQAQRAVAYRAFQAAYVQARCELPLFRRLDIGVTSPRLHNVALNASPAGNTWNLADWWLG